MSNDLVVTGDDSDDSMDSFDDNVGSHTVNSEEWDDILQNIKGDARDNARKRGHDQDQLGKPRKIQRIGLLQEPRKIPGPPQQQQPPQQLQSPLIEPGSTPASQQDKDRAELERLRRYNAKLLRELEERHPDSSYRNRYEDAVRARHSIPAEPSLEASVLEGTWNKKPVRDDGHLDLGMFNMR